MVIKVAEDLDPTRKANDDIPLESWDLVKNTMVGTSVFVDDAAVANGSPEDTSESRVRVSQALDLLAVPRSILQNLQRLLAVQKKFLLWENREGLTSNPVKVHNISIKVVETEPTSRQL